ERERSVGGLVGGREFEALEGAQHAAFDAWVLEGRAGDVGGRDAARWRNAEGDADVAFERGIVRRGHLEAGLERAHAGSNAARVRGGSGARTGCAFWRAGAFAAAPPPLAGPVTAAGAALAVAAETAPAGAARAAAEAAAATRAPTGVERAGAERHAAL